MMKPFDFTKQYILENNIVQLRPLEIEDIKNLIDFAIHEPHLWKYSLVTANSKENMINYIHSAIHARNENKEYPYIVFDKRTNEYAGCTRFYDMQLTNRSTQLGYTWYGTKFQGSGLNKHCKYLMLQFAFDQIGFDRVEFRADNMNERSIRAMKSIGCTEEGIIRSSSLRSDGTRRDSILLSILKNEWTENLGEQLKSKLTD